jgi:ACS family hexuronate transporter-like MFS transporter
MPADRSYRWVILGITTPSPTTVSMLNQGIAPLAPCIQDGYALSRAQVGRLNLALGLGSYLTVAASGRLSDRLGERAMILPSGIISGPFAAVALGSHDFASTMAIIVIMAAGVAISTPAGSKAVMGWFEVRVRGTAMGIRQVGIPLGGMLSAVLLPPPALLAGAGSGVPQLVSFRTVLANRGLCLISLYSIAMISAQFTFGLYLVVFAHERLGLSEVSSGALLVLAQGLAVGARIGWGV